MTLLVAGAVVAIVAVVASGHGRGGTDAPKPDTFARVEAPLASPPVPSGFVGLSMEFQSAAKVAGPAAHPNTVLQQLIRNLAPGQSPVIRIGGDSTDHAFWPAPGLQDPDRAGFALTPQWLASIRTLARALQARMMLGINLEAGNPRLAALEARALVNGIGRPSVQALEIGNEPNLYATLPWYTARSGVKVVGRHRPYPPSAYLSDFLRTSQVLPPLPLAAPALGAPHYMAALLGSLLGSTPRLTEVTYHRYPLNRCFTRPNMLTYPTIGHLMLPLASRGLADSVAGFARAARAHGDIFRVDELNSVACSGRYGISNTFASALWALDTLFSMARVGVSGVNVHTLPGAAYRLFTVHHTHGRWSVSVAPEYYGLLMFSQAAPPGSRLLTISVRGSAAIRAWATTGPGRVLRVALINDSVKQAHTVEVGVASGRGNATVERLRAPSLQATHGVTLGGRSFAQRSTTGALPASPRLLKAGQRAGGYVVTLPASSAALLAVGLTSR